MSDNTEYRTVDGAVLLMEKTKAPVYCTFPWYHFNIGLDNKVRPCCALDSFGNLAEKSFDELWNGDRMQELRAAMLDGRQHEQGCPKNCTVRSEAVPAPHLCRDRAVAKRWAEAEQAVIEGRLIAPAPLDLGVTLTHQCNLACIMCPQEHHKHEVDRERLKDVLRLLPNCSSVAFSGGEIFLISWLDDFMEQQVLPLLGEHTTVCIITNGTLLNSRRRHILKRIPRLHLAISMDGFTKETYEHIRVGAQWDFINAAIDQVQKDLDCLPRRSRHFNFTVMATNFHELSKAAEFAATRGFNINYNAILGFTYFEENCFAFRGARRRIGDWRQVLADAHRAVAEMTVQYPDFVATGLDTLERKLVRSPIALPDWVVRLANRDSGRRYANPFKALARKLAHRAVIRASGDHA